MPDFDYIFPNFTARCVDLQHLLMPVAFVLLVSGIISAIVVSHHNEKILIHTIGRTIVYIVLLTFLVNWGNSVSAIVDNTVKNVLKVDPTQIQKQYNAALVMKKSPTETQQSWWDKILKFTASFFEAMLSVFFYILGWIASAIVFYAYIIQKIILYTGYALAPIFVGLLAFGTTRGVGTRYFLHLIGVMIWPLGWGVAGLVTQSLMDYMTNQSFLQSPSFIGTAQYGLQGLIGLAFLGVWIIFSTIAAPAIIQRSLVDGILAGSPMMSGAAAAGKAGASTALTTTATMAAKAIDADGNVNWPLVRASAATGLLAGLESLASTSAGLGGGSVIGSLAQMRPLAEQKKDDDDDEEDDEFPPNDLTGDKTVKKIIRRSKNPHSPE